jgi:hypothetical protein
MQNNLNAKAEIVAHAGEQVALPLQQTWLGV